MGDDENEHERALEGLAIVINNMKSVAAKALHGVLLELMEASPQIAALATVAGSPGAQALSRTLKEGSEKAMFELTKILTEKLEEFRKLQTFQAKGVSEVADVALDALGNVLKGPGGRTVASAAISGDIKKAKIEQGGIGNRQPNATSVKNSAPGSSTTPHTAPTNGGTRRHKKTPKKYRKKSHRKHTRRQRRQHTRRQRRQHTRVQRRQHTWRQRRQHTRFRRKQTSLYKRR